MSIGFSAGALVRLGQGRYRVDFSAGFRLAHLASGLEKLAMEVLYFMWTTEGSVLRDQTRGTRLTEMIGTYSVGVDLNLLQTALTNEMIKAETRIIARQAEVVLPADERLKNIILDSIEIDPELLMADVRIIINNELDQAVGLQLAVGG